MFWQPIDRFASKIFGPVPLRTVLVVPFVIQIVGVVMLVGWLSWRHSHQAVTDLAQQLQTETTQRIHDYLHTHLAKPHLLNQVNINALQLGLVELTQKQRLINHFWHQISHFKLTHYMGIATAKTYIGVRRLKEQLIIVEYLDEQGQLNIWETDQQAQLKQLRSQIAHFNPQIQPWYQAALNNQHWTGVYAQGQHLSLYASRPLYHQSDTQVQAVLSVNIELLELSQFLAQLSPGHSFIMDDKGLLIASSQPEVLFDSLA
ncbi:MAG: cache domain-containing protein, partial [Pseudomonadota bacterium]|nr:cache domain-containing protein [Pseudomonadota bacterium]